MAKHQLQRKVVGTTEDRLNRFMEMCLSWQRDIRQGVERTSAYYFTKFHFSKVRRSLIGDLRNVVIDRAWAIRKLNSISMYRTEENNSKGIRATNRTIYTEDSTKPTSHGHGMQLDLFTEENTGLSTYPTEQLFAELMRRMNASLNY